MRQINRNGETDGERRLGASTEKQHIQEIKHTERLLLKHLVVCSNTHIVYSVSVCGSVIYSDLQRV